MGWSISTHDLRAVSSVEQAKKIWDDGKPWRDQHTSWRPLAGRRAIHKRIVKLHDDKGYECVLFRTALVTYLTDGSVILRCHGSVSSHAFANCVSPIGCSPVPHKSEMFWKIATKDGTLYLQPKHTDLVLEPTDVAGRWKVFGEVAEHTERVYDYKIGAAARKAIKPYVDWYNLTARLGGIKHNCFFRVLEADVRSLLKKPDDPELFLRLAQSGGTPADVRHAAYALMGAYYAISVPHYRLPRI